MKTTVTRRALGAGMAALALCLGLGLAGCSSAPSAGDTPSHEKSQGSRAADDKMATDPGAAVQTAQAIDTQAAYFVALSDAGQSEATVKDAETTLADENGNPVYNVAFTGADGTYTYTVDGTTGEVLSRLKPGMAQPETMAAPGGTMLTEGAAQAIAAESAGVPASEAASLSCQLKEDGDAPAYLVELEANGTKASVTVDALTGAVLEQQ